MNLFAALVAAAAIIDFAVVSRWRGQSADRDQFEPIDVEFRERIEALERIVIDQHKALGKQINEL